MNIFDQTPNEDVTFGMLEHEIALLEDEAQLQKLICSYNLLHSGGQHQATAELFARRDDCSMELSSWGVQKGYDRICRMFVDFHNSMQGVGENRRGFNAEHCPMTPVIEVAEDRQTARCLLHNIGSETYVYHGEVSPVWTWVKGGDDFIKVDGRWYRWHGHAYDVFACEYKNGWGTPPPLMMRENSDRSLASAGLLDSLPTTYHLQFSKDYVADYHPEVPKPYDTFKESDSMA